MYSKNQNFLVNVRSSKPSVGRSASGSWFSLLCLLIIRKSPLFGNPPSLFLGASIGLHFVSEPSSLRAFVTIALLSSSLPCILHFKLRAKKSSTICYNTSRSWSLQSQLLSPAVNYYHLHLFSGVIPQGSKRVGISSS